MKKPDPQEALPRWRSTSIIQSRARELRKALTPAENKLWRYLRHHQLEGAHFRRQHTVGRFAVKTICKDNPLLQAGEG